MIYLDTPKDWLSREGMFMMVWRLGVGVIKVR